MSKERSFQKVAVTELASKGITAHTDRPRPVVLVVDDETVIADTLTAILAKEGIAAIAAYDGQSALQIARTIPPDLLLTDVVMPGMNGIDLAIAICDTIPDCKILLFSGQASTVDLLANARAAGRNFRTLDKPIHPTELLACISDSLKFRPAGLDRVPVLDLQASQDLRAS